MGQLIRCSFGKCLNGLLGEVIKQETKVKVLFFKAIHHVQKPGLKLTLYSMRKHRNFSGVKTEDMSEQSLQKKNDCMKDLISNVM